MDLKKWSGLIASTVEERGHPGARLIVATAGMFIAALTALASFMGPETIATLFGMVVVVTAAFMTKFLSPEKDEVESKGLSIEVQKIKELVLRQGNIPEEVKANAVDALRSKIEETASKDLIENLRSEIRERELNLEVYELSRLTLSRMTAEVNALGRRAAINLSLGFAAGLMGVGLLTYLVLIVEQKPFIGMGEFAMHFIPRFSIIATIEVFAYFFLRLYKSSLGEIKYYQNEMTNAEARYCAQLITLRQGDSDAIRTTVSSLLTVERNPLLTGDQRQESLDLERLYSTPVAISPHHLASVLDKVKFNGTERSGEAK